MDTTVGILLGKGPMSCHAYPFKLVIQQVLRIPQQWKTSSVVPIPKSSTNIDDPHNYRPISLLPVIRKLLERHVYRLVSQHLAERKLISDAQWGFTPGKSTIIALLSTFHDILQFLEYDRRLPHLRKAFDSVSHLPLLNKIKTSRHRTGAACPSMVDILSE